MPSVRERAIGVGAPGAWLFATLCLAAWTVYAGKDLSWDVLNHHVYLPFSLTSGRFATDLFAAGPQSTQHPLGYLPFWGLLELGTPSWGIGAAFVVAHATLAVPLWRIVTTLWPDAHDDFWWRWLALMLALLAPSLLLLAGTSSNDPLTAVLVLWALSTCLPGRRRTADAVVAGLLLGAAIAIKPTNVVFAIACIAAWGCRRTPWRGLVVLGAATAGMALLLQAPWSWWLWQAYQSPLYPLFNHIFQSPYAPLEAVQSTRFMPAGVLDGLWRPFVIAQPQRMTHTEALAPDLRPALCVLGVAAALLAATWRRWRHGAAQEARPGADREVLVFTAVGYALWLATSGNSRYALPLFILVGVVLVRAVQLALPAGAARVVLGLAVVLQAGYFFELGSRRFDNPVAWGAGPYVDTQVPPRLRDTPVLHLSLGTPSFAVLAPVLHRDGAFVNAISTMSLPTAGPLGDKLNERLVRWQGRTRVLFKGRPPLADNERAAAARASHDRSIYRFGLKIDWRDCEELRIRTPLSAGIGGSTPASGAAPPVVPGIAVTSCAAQARAADDPGYATELALAERVFATIESQCPRVFGPAPMVTNADTGAWHRHYLNSDARVMVSPTDGVLISHFSVYRTSLLGSMDEVLAGRGLDACIAWRTLLAP